MLVELCQVLALLLDLGLQRLEPGEMTSACMSKGSVDRGMFILLGFLLVDVHALLSGFTAAE